jgi:hypothetical protein
MNEYRVYFLDDHEHVFFPAQRFDAVDDIKAVRAASELLDGQAAEVWEGRRLVACLGSKTTPPNRVAEVAF